MAGAYGNSLLGEQVREVGVMDAVDHKADQRTCGEPSTRTPLRAFKPRSR